MSKKSVLGKGIGALLNTSIATPATIDNFQKEKTASSSVSTKNEIRNSETSLVPISKIKPNVDQPRRVFKNEEIEELSASIKENGIIQPLIVTYDSEDNKFEIIAGERRFRAAKKAGLKEVPVFIKRVTKKEKLAMAIIENVQRSDLNCVEEALAYDLTQDQVATTVGKSRSSIANTLRVLRLPKEVIVMLQKEQLSFGHAKVLMSVKDENQVIELAKQVIKNEWSVKHLNDFLKPSDDDEDKPKPAKKSIKSNTKVDALRQKLERQTGFHFEIKSNEKNKGKISIKFNDKDEFNTIYQFLLDL